MEGLTTKPEAEQSEPPFYRPTKLAAAVEYSTEELRERKALTEAIIANLKIIREQAVGLDELGEKIASLATALRLLRELEQEQERGAKDDAA